MIKKDLEYEGLKKIHSDKSIKILKKFKIKTKLGDRILLHVKTKDLTTDSLMKKLKGYYFIESASPNYKHSIDATFPNDPNFNSLWGLNNSGQSGGTVDKDIDTPEVWDTQTGSSDRVVAVIDTGVDYNHDDLAANMWVNPFEIAGNGIDDDSNGYIDDIYGCNPAEDKNSNAEGDPMDIDTHGTHVAGTIGAVGNNGIGVTGVNWNVKIMAFNVMEESSGSLWTDDEIEALAYIQDMKSKGVNIVAVNASYGGTGGSQNDSMAQTIRALIDDGIMFCAAAGNGGTDYVADDNDAIPHYPSSYNEENIISVANTDHNDAYATSSNYGVTSVDLSGPGSAILSTVPGQGFIPDQANIFFDNFENGMDNWTNGGTHTTWTISEDQEIFEDSNFPVPSPTHFLSDSPANWSSFNANLWVMLNSDIDLSSYTGETLYLGFGHAWHIPDGCHGYVEVSSNSGNDWIQLADYTDPDYYYKWQNPIILEIPEVVKTNNFRLRFRMTTGSSVGKGWLIDNVGIGTNLSSIYGYKGGTSMATPHVAGAISMLAAEFPDENITVRKDRILASIDPLSSTGKTVTDGRLNLYNAIQNPALVSITPQYGMVSGNSFTLDGHSFGGVTGSVEFVDEANNSVEATVTAWGDSQITATIPSAYPGKKIRIARSTDSKSGYINGSRWSNETALSVGFDSAVTVSSGGKIYAIGGQVSFAETATLRIFDPSSGWSTGTDIPTPRSYASAVVLNGNIYVMGGYSQSGGQVVDNVDIYSIASNTWSTGISLPSPLAFARAAVLNSEIYISGGTIDGTVALQTMYKFDGATWSQETNMPDARMAHGMIEYNNYLYVFGGADWYYQTGADYTESKKMYIYDPAGSGSWSDSGKDLPIALARFGFSQGLEDTDTVIKVAGGTDDTSWWSNQLQTVMTYNFTTNQWYQTNEGLDELIINKIGSGMVFIDGQGFYNVGGYSEASGTLDDFEKYE